jgi:BON domain
MTRRDTHLDAMLRNLGARYYQTTQGRARAADVTRALESVAAEEQRINGGGLDEGDAITVTARDGVVTLSGTVAGKDMVPVAVRLASEGDGVVAVQDKLSSIVPAASA